MLIDVHIGKKEIQIDGEDYDYQGELDQENLPSGIGEAFNKYTKYSGMWLNGEPYGASKLI